MFSDTACSLLKKRRKKNNNSKNPLYSAPDGRQAELVIAAEHNGAFSNSRARYFPQEVVEPKQEQKDSSRRHKYNFN